MGNLFVIALALAFPLCAHAQTYDFDRDALKGIDKIKVAVEDVREDIQADGLVRSVIQTDVELKVRLAGIVIPLPEKLTSCPLLLIKVETLKLAGGKQYAVWVHVSVLDFVMLKRDQNIVHPGAIIWSRNALSVGGSNTVAAGARRIVKDFVGEFLNDWLSVNPKGR